MKMNKKLGVIEIKECPLCGKEILSDAMTENNHCNLCSMSLVNKKVIKIINQEEKSFCCEICVERYEDIFEEYIK